MNGNKYDNIITVIGFLQKEKNRLKKARGPLYKK